jgi:hypothetical protein
LFSKILGPSRGPQSLNSHASAGPLLSRCHSSGDPGLDMLTDGENSESKFLRPATAKLRRSSSSWSLRRWKTCGSQKKVHGPPSRSGTALKRSMFFPLHQSHILPLSSTSVKRIPDQPLLGHNRCLVRPLALAAVCGFRKTYRLPLPPIGLSRKGPDTLFGALELDPDAEAVSGRGIAE